MGQRFPRPCGRWSRRSSHQASARAGWDSRCRDASRGTRSYRAVRHRLDGVLVVHARPFWAWRRATRTAYVLTDRRAIVLSCGARGSVQVRSFEATALRNVQRTQHPDGSGDVVLAIDRKSDAEGGQADHPAGFLAVRDVRAVEARVRALASERRIESPSGG